MWPQGERVERCSFEPGVAWRHHGLEDAKKGVSPRASKGVWSCPHLDFGLSDFRTVKSISLVLSQAVCNNLLQ